MVIQKLVRTSVALLFAGGLASLVPALVSPVYAQS